MKFDLGWTRDKNINLWPIFKYKKDTSIGFVQTDALFSLFHYERNRELNLKYSHLFPIWRKKSNVNGNDFRLFSLYYPSVFHKSEDIGQGIKSFDFLEIAPGISALGFSKSADGLYINNNLLFLLWFNRNEVNKSSYLIFFPLYWSFKNQQRNTNIVFPLWANGNLNYGKTKYTAISPLFLHISKDTRKYNFLFPVFWNARNKDTVNSWKRNIVFPLWYSYSDNKQKKQILLPIAFRFKKPERQSFTFLPFYSLSKDSSGSKKILMVTPIYWNINYYEEKTRVVLPLWISFTDDYRKNRYFLPFVYYQKKQTYRSLTVLPLFSYGADSTRTRNHFAVTPLYWHFKENDKIVNTVFPLFWDIKGLSEIYPRHRTVFFPLLYRYHDNYKNNFSIFPVLYVLHNSDYRSFTFLPFLSYGRSADSTSKHLSIATVYWQFKHKNDSRHILFPLWWNREYQKYNGKYYHNVIFPIYWSYNNPKHINKVIFPLSWSLKNPYYHSYTFAPFFSYGNSPNQAKKHVAISPLFWNIKNEYANTTAFFPLLWHTLKKGPNPSKRTIVLPFWWSKSDSLTSDRIFFPLVWSLKNPNFNSKGVFLLFSSSYSTDGYRSISNITPLFWKFKNSEKKASFLIPFYFSSSKKGSKKFKRSFAFPIWYSFNDSLNRNRVFFPFVWSLKNPNYQSTTIFPIFSVGKNKEGSRKHKVISPLFWSVTNEQSSTRLLFPVFDSKIYTNGDKNLGILYFLYRYKKEDQVKRSDIIWPVCQYKTGPDLSYFRLAPIVWYKKTNETKFFSIQPIFYQYKNTESSDFHLLWQLFTFEKIYGKQKSWNFLWKLLYYQKYQPKGHEFRFLYMVFADVKKEGYKEKSFFPFYYFSKEDNGNRSLSLFFYFYNSFRRQLPNSLEFYKEERIFWFIRLRSNYKRLKAEGKI